MGDYGFEGAAEFGGTDFPDIDWNDTDSVTKLYPPLVAKPSVVAVPKKRQKIKVGDRVRILEPEFFIRCGYENNIDDLMAEIYQKERTQINTFSDLMGGISEHGIDKIVRQVAYERLHRKKKEGNPRLIFTHREESFKGQDYSVSRIQFVKTGIYSASTGGYHDDYDPAYLANEQTHRILHLRMLGKVVTGSNRNFELSSIEDVHVQKIEL